MRADLAEFQTDMKRRSGWTENVERVTPKKYLRKNVERKSRKSIE
jgi:hypothetical protein